MKIQLKIQRKSAIFEPNSNQIDNKIELFLNQIDLKLSSNSTQILGWDNILNNGFGLRGQNHVYLTKICTMLTWYMVHGQKFTTLTPITNFIFCGGYRTMEHGPCSMTSITKLKMLGGYRTITSCIFLDFNWITSITKFKFCGGYRPCTTYHHLHGRISPR